MRAHRHLLLCAASTAVAAGFAVCAPSQAFANRSSSVDTLTASKSGVVAPARPRRLPGIRVPLRPPSEPGGDAGIPGGGGPQVPMLVAPAPLVQFAPRRTQQLTDSPALGGSLEGPGSGVWNPADVQIGVGPSDVVEMTNGGYEIWSKSGVKEAADTLGAFFTSAHHDRRLDQMSDPRVLWDAQSQHWFSMALDVTTRENILVVSPTALPGSSNGWIYTFPSSGCPDQPRLGVSDTLIAFGDDYFSDCSTQATLSGGELTVIDKSSVLNGGTANDQQYGPSPTFGHITPAFSVTSTGMLYFAATDFLFNTIGLFSASTVQAGSLPVTRVPVAGLAQAPDALQSDPSLISTGDNRVQNAVWQNGTLYLAISDGCQVVGEIGTFACAHYLGINTASDQITFDDGAALDQNRDMFYPAIAPSGDGTLFTVFGYSSANETPGIGIQLHPSSGSSWTILKQGSGANESGRWGDYFGIAPDPSDPTRVWVAAAYGSGGTTWGTTVGALGEASFTITPPAAPPAPVSTPPSSPSPPTSKPTSKPKPKPKPKKHRA